MGLFDRLFGKIEKPKIEDVVKEALENIDLSDDSQKTETLESENIEVKEQDGTVVAEENDEDLFETEVDEETIVESVDEVKVSQEELNQVQDANSPQEESTHVEEIPSMIVTKKKLFSLNQTKQKQSFLKKRKQTKQSKKLLKSKKLNKKNMTVVLRKRVLDSVPV